MQHLRKLLVAGTVGLLALGAASAHAERDRDRDSRSDVSFSVRVSDGDYYRHDRYDRYDRHDRYDRYDRYDRGRRHGYRGRSGRIVNREIYPTRYRARIVLTEELVRTRRGPRLLCTVQARGPEARYVSDRRLHRIANRQCSHRARVRVYT